MTNKISATILILIVAYLGVCAWSYGQKTMKASLEIQDGITKIQQNQNVTNALLLEASLQGYEQLGIVK